MKKLNSIQWGLVLILCLGVLFLLIAFEPQTRAFLGKSSVAPYPYPLSNGFDANLQIADLEKRIKIDPSSALYRAMLASALASQAKTSGDTTLYTRAEELAKLSLKMLPFSNSTASLTLAAIAEAKHHFKEAIEIAQKVNKEGKKTEGLSILITAHLAMGQLDEASLYADILVNERPSIGTLALRALVLHAMGRDPEAEYDFKRAIALEDIGEATESAWVRCLLGRFYLGEKRFGEARDLFKESLRIRPNYHFALSLMGELALKQEDFQDAEKFFFNAFTASRQLNYFRRYGSALKLQKKLSTAEQVLVEVESKLREDLKIDTFGHRLELVELLLEKADGDSLKEALSLLESELQNRKTSDVYFLQAKVLLALEQKDAALTAIQTSLRSGIRESKYYLLASQIEALLGNENKAILYTHLAK